MSIQQKFFPPAHLKSTKYLYVFNYDVMYKIILTKSPYNQEDRFWRLVAALPNIDGRTLSQCEVPSFRQKYMVARSSDYVEYPEQKDIDKFVRKLQARKFRRIVSIES